MVCFLFELHLFLCLENQLPPKLQDISQLKRGVRCTLPTGAWLGLPTASWLGVLSIVSSVLLADDGSPLVAARQTLHHQLGDNGDQ